MRYITKDNEKKKPLQTITKGSFINERYYNYVEKRFFKL